MRRAALVSVAVLALLAGCGGNDEDDAFTEDANAVCRRYSQDIRALAAPQSFEQLIRYVDELTRLSGERVDELRALAPPEDAAGDFDRFVQQLARTQTLLGGLRRATALGQTAEVRAVLDQAKKSDAAAGEIASDLGLDRCAGSSADG